MFSKLLTFISKLLDLIVTKQHTAAQQEAAVNADKPQDSIDDVTNAGSVTELIDNIHNVKNQKMKNLLFLVLISIGLTGCRTSQIQTLPTYPWETVYNVADTKITINGQPIKVDKKERVWIITDRTLGYIIYDAKHHYYR